MNRFIVRFRGSAPKHDVMSRIEASPSVTVIEETQRMVLVESLEEDLRNAVGDAPDVVIVPERHYEHPNPPLTVNKR